jgi:phage gpG-like protein
MKITTDNVAKVLASIQELAGKQVLVGIPATKAEREDGEPINNAQLGYIHEYGAPASNIPARPFLIPGVAHAQESINNHLQKAAKAAMSGNDEKVDTELNATGLIAQAGARNEINNGNFEALSARTLADRRKRGRTGDKPLIDTGQLRNSITYVIRKKE